MTTENTNKKNLTLFQDIFHPLVLKWTRQFTIFPLNKLVEGTKTHQKTIYMTVTLSQQLSRTINSFPFKKINISLQKIAKKLLFHKYIYCTGCVTELYLKNTSKATDS